MQLLPLPAQSAQRGVALDRTNIPVTGMASHASQTIDNCVCHLALFSPSLMRLSRCFRCWSPPVSKVKGRGGGCGLVPVALLKAQFLLGYREGLVQGRPTCEHVHRPRDGVGDETQGGSCPRATVWHLEALHRCAADCIHCNDPIRVQQHHVMLRHCLRSMPTRSLRAPSQQDSRGPSYYLVHACHSNDQSLLRSKIAGSNHRQAALRNYHRAWRHNSSTTQVGETMHCC